MLCTVFALAVLPQGPVEFGRTRLEAALARHGGAKQQASVEVDGQGPPESFRVQQVDDQVRVRGADARGAMYGALEAAERVSLAAGATTALRREIRGEPFLADRGWNVFLTLPWDYAKSVTDYDEAALVDGARWWFHDEQYWNSLFDLMAESRLNWLDLHGMWDIDVTDAPNLFPYFVRSERFPEVGPSVAVQAKCLERLRWIVDRAHARGVQVSLMSYEARFYTPHRKQPPYEPSDANLAAYTREVVATLLRAVPTLDRIGFRIGESGRGERFYECYLAALADVGRDIPLLARTWLAKKSKVVPLARGSRDFTLEIKFNGEQWGPPYFVAGGRMANWYSYSFEDYLSDSGAGENQRTWPGHEAGGGSRWPAQPYKIVWQVRANGTHRVFPFYEPEWIRRTVAAMRVGTTSGFSVEPLNTYYPAETRWIGAAASAGMPKWFHERDELYLKLWGRLGYDPTLGEATFDAWFTERFGAAGRELAAAWKLASQVVPRAFTAYSMGPDHRQHAPELEWGGSTSEYVLREPFDTHVFRSVKEDLAYRWSGGRDGRRNLREALTPLAGLAVPSEGPSSDVRAAALGRWIRDSIALLIALRDYYQARFAGAEEWALADAEVRANDEPAGRAIARLGAVAVAAWRTLSESKLVTPFSERLRMRTRAYHWRNQLPLVEQDAEAAITHVKSKSTMLEARAAAPRAGSPSRDRELVWREVDGKIEASLDAKGLSAAALLTKPLPSTTFFHKVPMQRAGDRFVVTVPRDACGMLLAAEIENSAGCVRIPDWEKTAPYLTVPALPRPTALYYSSLEALTYLDPAVLTPEKHGLLLVCPRAWSFHRFYDVPTQRKLLDAVARGMTLLVLQQDYVSGRYPLAWLPNPPRVAACDERVLDPAGALGIPRITTDGILWQRFLPTPGWRVYGNGGIARSEHGKGAIWLVQARLMQRMHVPECARAMKSLVEFGGKTKPVVLVDVGTEGGEFGTSVWPDFLNAHEVPFLTLGEVVAREQGPDVTKPIPGRVAEDRILLDKGGSALAAVYDAKVKAAARRPVPASREAFETWRAAARPELLRGLGLDPMPERTPLVPRVTGTLQRDGYRIEKVVYESRPGFPVTAHLYVPDGLAGKAPVIVNPHGHWAHKKQEPVVQMRAIAQAKAGYVAFVVDSPGHSFEGKAKVERREAGPHDDYKLVQGGTNTTGIYVWDLMRGLDYLATRPECDLTKVGITGASGGGLATLYAFAADERFTCAVPVVYATSLEVNPHNGCLCNHVPGTLRVGDRADVLALRAPFPVLVIGAQQDGEFPPAGTELTGKKLSELWKVFGAADRVRAKVFPGPHDYNQAMREAALGFFDLHLRGLGDGSPRKEPACTPLPAEAPELFVAPPPESFQLTMRDIAMQGYAAAKAIPVAEIVRLNGGMPVLPKAVVTQLSDAGAQRLVTIESEQGLRVPALLRLPAATPTRVVVIVDDRGKVVAGREPEVEKLILEGAAVLLLDARGCGELAAVDLRLLAYLGTSTAFAMAVDVVQATRAVAGLAPRVEVVGRGPIAAQAALFAGCLEPAIASVREVGGLGEFDEAFRPEVPTAAVQPRGAAGVRLATLRAELGARLAR